LDVFDLCSEKDAIFTSQNTESSTAEHSHTHQAECAANVSD